MIFDWALVTSVYMTSSNFVVHICFFMNFFNVRLHFCNQLPFALEQILKKICDHPLLLTKRAAEDVLEGMDSMLNPEDAGVAEKLAMHVADVAERTDFQEKHDNVSCKISFILSLLVRDVSKSLLMLWICSLISQV